MDQDDFYKEYLYEFEQRIKEANEYLISEQELLIYKNLIAECIPPNVEITDSQIMRMKYWEKDNNKTIEEKKQIGKLFGDSSNDLNNEEARKWRKGYIEKLIESNNELNELSKQELGIQRRIGKIKKYYGLAGEINLIIPMSPQKDSIRRALNILFSLEKDENAVKKKDV